MITGSVSSGTREEDLIPCFMKVLDDIREDIVVPGPTTEPADKNAERGRLVGRIDDLLGSIESRMGAEGYYGGEKAGWDMESLFDMLNEVAPEGYYFGADPGNGSCYGFWEVEDPCQ